MLFFINWVDKISRQIDTIKEVNRELKQAERAADIQGNYSLAEGIAKQCVSKLERTGVWRGMWPYPQAQKALEDYKRLNEQERKTEEDIPPAPRRKKAA